ncbi:MAG TPA: SIMPL domain-containing protein [Steroidobacteraceae bacterium]|nr:SIMPL domain-containing protein [Steroidobacteraceae bacterium]
MRLLVAVALSAASSWAMAQSPPGAPSAPPPRPATIQVTGQAKVSKPPDRVYIDIGVTTQARKSEAATEQNATRVSAVIAAVKRAAGTGVQLTTTQYSVGPNYNYPRGGGTPTIAGYTASNVVQVRLDDLSRLGRVIDAATQAGSNNVQDIRFALRDEAVPRAEALREAAQNARRDAEALAEALDLEVVRVLAVGEEVPEGRPLPLYAQKMSVAAARTPATPVEAGTIDIDATVTLTVEVAPAKR